MFQLSKITKTLDLLFLVFFGLLVYYLLSPATFEAWNSILYGAEKVLIGLQFILISLTFLILKTFIQKKIISFCIIDAALIAYGFFLLIHATLLKPVNLNSIFIFENILIGVIYICFRNIHSNKIIYFICIFIIAGLHQIFYDVLEQINDFPLGYNLSEIKGGFINQGSFAGFIASLVLISFVSLIENNKIYTKKRVSKLIYLMLFVLFSIILFYSNSRAAWFATLIGLIFYLGNKFRFNFSIKNYFILLVFLVGLLYSLYQYKKDSANGRVLIWKITSEMISNKPILGHGVNSFEKNYMFYQESYFKKNENHPYQYLADNNYYTFNEFLKLWCEKGLVGILMFSLFLFVFIYSVKKSDYFLKKEKIRLISQSGLILIFCFGLFSYPMKILEIKIISVFFITTLTNSINKKNRVYFFRIKIAKTLNKYLIILSFSIMILLFSKTYKIFNVYANWNIALLDLRKGEYKQYIRFSKKNNHILNRNGYFLGYYGKSLMLEKEYKNSIIILEKALKLIPSSKILIDIGKCYEKLECFKEAEKNWNKAKNMCPSQFRPEYLIAKMYFENGEKEKAKEIALNLLKNKKRKVYSVEVHKIIVELKKMTNE